MESWFPNGEVDTLRLLGVDTSETFGENDSVKFDSIPETVVDRDHLANWSGRATAFATDEPD
jgi:micrococcal nuclease